MNKFVGQQAYQNNATANPKIDDAHGAISVCLETLLHSLKVLSERPQHGSEQFNRISAKCLTAVHILQTSLDFEKGGALADNLFQLYEYVKYQIISNLKKEGSVNIEQSVSIISEINDSWAAIK